jgi:hypothetical protein
MVPHSSAEDVWKLHSSFGLLLRASITMVNRKGA